MTPIPEEQFHNEILEKIKTGQVTMRSRAFLQWRTVLFTLGLLLLLAAAVFVISFVIFSLRTSGVSDLPSFGLHGLQEFLAYFPWLFVPAALLFIWLLERFVLQYSFAYRMPVLYTTTGIVVFTLGASFLVLFTPLHNSLYESARQQHLPLAGGLYRFFGNSHPDDFYVGEITTVKDQNCIILTREGTPLNVTTDSHTQFYNTTGLHTGDFIELVGEEHNNIVQAYDIRKVDSNHFPPPPPIEIRIVPTP